MPKLSEILSSGVMGIAPALLARDYMRDAAEDSDAAAKAARAAQAGQAPQPGMKKGGKVGSASKRADGIAQRGKTRGKMY